MKSNETRVGVVVVLSLALIIFGYFYLRGLGLSADRYYLRVVGATNVAPGNEVRLQGVKIGQVQEVSLDREQKPVMTIVVRRANPPLHLLKTYEYTVQAGALLGENYVDIRGRYDSAAPLYEPNDPKQVISAKAISPLVGVTDQATLLIGDMRTTLAKFNVTVERVNKGVLSYDNQLRLARALENVARLTERAGKSFGPEGFKVGLGDPRAQRGLNDTLENTAAASRQAALAAGDLRVMARDLRGVVGDNRAQVNALLTNLNKTANNVGGLAESLKFLVDNGGLKENLNETLVSVKKAAQNIEATTAAFKNSLGSEQTQKDLQATLASARQSAQNIEDLTTGLKDLAGDDTQKSLRTALASLSETAASLRDTALVIKNTVADPETQKQVKSTLATINQVSATLSETAANLKDSSAGIKNVVGDPKFQNDLKALPGDLRASAGELKETLVAARGAATAAQQVAQSVNNLLPRRRNRNGSAATGGTGTSAAAGEIGGAAFPSGVHFDYRRMGGFGGSPRLGADVSGENYGDATLDTSLFGGPFRLGVSNIGEGADFTLQSGRYFGDNVAARYGIYRSKLGAGVELRRGKVWAEGNLWNPNDTSYNAYLGYSVTPQVDVFAGRESIRGVRASSLGVRLRP